MYCILDHVLVLIGRFIIFLVSFQNPPAADIFYPSRSALFVMFVSHLTTPRPPPSADIRDDAAAVVLLRGADAADPDVLRYGSAIHALPPPAQQRLGRAPAVLQPAGRSVVTGVSGAGMGTVESDDG